MGILGPSLILIFGLSQAVRDVYFGHLFQTTSFFSVILLAFSISAVIFGLLAAVRRPQDFALLRRRWRTTLAMVLATTLAWPFYFFALSRIEPSVANTIHSGMAPLTAVALAVLGSGLIGRAPAGQWERRWIGATAASMMLLAVVVIAGHAGLSGSGIASRVAGLLAVVVSGSAITVSLLYAKRLNDAGIGSEAVTAVRYLLLIAIAAGLEIGRVFPSGHLTWENLPTLSVATTVLMVLPLFALQVGIERTPAMSAQIIRALGPVFVFALEQVDDRISYSTPTLVCILAYSVFTIASNLAHAGAGRASTANRRANHVHPPAAVKPAPSRRRPAS